jgi:hypothetical protein
MKITFRQSEKRRKSTPENQRLNVAQFLSYENFAPSV